MSCSTQRQSQRRLHFVLIVLLLTYDFILGGIVGLSKHLRVSYKGAWTTDVGRIAPLDIDHLCIDMNQVIHGCFRTTRSATHRMARIFIKLDEILNKAPPKKSLVLAFDGPAPFAKLQTQHKRRKAEPEVSLITPGTEFMNSMESIMICYVLQRIKKQNLSDVAVFISDATCPGEGELKIIDWIQRNMPRSEVDSSGIVVNSGQHSDNTAATIAPISSGFIDTSTTVSSSTSATTRSSSSASSSISISASASAGTTIRSSTDKVLICGSDSDIVVQALCNTALAPNTLVLQLGTEAPDAVCNVSALLAALVRTTGIDVNALMSLKLEQEQEQERSGERKSSNKKAADAAANLQSLDDAYNINININSNSSISDCSNRTDSSTSKSQPPQQQQDFSHHQHKLDLLQQQVAQLHTVQLDMVVLFALLGNDYLPKLRSVSTLRALKAYGQAMAALPVQERHLVNLVAVEEEEEKEEEEVEVEVVVAVEGKGSKSNSSSGSSSEQKNISSAVAADDVSAGKHEYNETGASKKMKKSQSKKSKKSKSTFNFIALWALMKRLYESDEHRSCVPLPITVPDAVSFLSQLLQRRASAGKGGGGGGGGDGKVVVPVIVIVAVIGYCLI